MHVHKSLGIKSRSLQFQSENLPFYLNGFQQEDLYWYIWKLQWSQGKEIEEQKSESGKERLPSNCLFLWFFNERYMSSTGKVSSQQIDFTGMPRVFRASSMFYIGYIHTNTYGNIMNSSMTILWKNSTRLCPNNLGKKMVNYRSTILPRFWKWIWLTMLIHFFTLSDGF